MHSDVVVVGAGPTGLALACGLTEAGVNVRVVDAAAAPAVTSRALGLQPRGVEVLNRLGALGDLPQHGIPVSRVVVHVNGRELAQLRIGGATRLGGPRALLMSQADIEGALRDRLRALGGGVEWGRRAARVEGGPDAAVVHFDDGATLHSGWVVGADGAHSAVRKSLGVGFPGVPLVEGFLLADVHADLDRPRDAVCTWLQPNGPFAAFPLPGADLWRLMAPAPEGRAADPGPDDVIAELGSLLAANGGGTIRSVEWTSSFRIQRRLAESYRRGRVLLAGDAAHIHSPLGGQGMNTGIGDAENLAWKLALVVTGRADVRLLDTYEAERRPVAKDVLATTSNLTGLVVGDRRAARFLRDRVAVHLLNTPWLQRLITERASQLRVSYRHGPLGSPGRFPQRGLRVGDRVADRPVTRADGSATRLHTELGPQWALVGPESLAVVARGRLGEVVRLRGDGAALLVRPDGHLAWQGDNPKLLAAWLDSALGEPAGVLAP